MSHEAALSIRAATMWGFRSHRAKSEEPSEQIAIHEMVYYRVLVNDLIMNSAAPMSSKVNSELSRSFVPLCS